MIVTTCMARSSGREIMNVCPCKPRAQVTSKATITTIAPEKGRSTEAITIARMTATAALWLQLYDFLVAKHETYAGEMTVVLDKFSGKRLKAERYHSNP